jgi:hypothetical protein
MHFSENSRVWIYQADRVFLPQELYSLHHLLQSFTASWQAHGHELRAGYEIRYSRFIILLVDEVQAGATGCSIDKSVNLMKTLEHDFGVTLFDRFNIAYKKAGEVLSCNRRQFQELINTEAVDENTIVFDNTVQTRKQLETNWEIPLKQSWHPRIFEFPVKQQ